MRKRELNFEIEKTLRQIAKLPPWMQEIILDDINSTIRNRIAIFEMISRKVTGKSA